MIASDWVEGISVVVGDQGTLVGGADLPVPPDRRGQGEQALGDPDPDTGQGPAAVAFQPQLVFEGVKGALDPLAPATQRPQPMRLISPVGAQQDRAIAADQLLELPAGEALVTTMRSPAAAGGARGPAWPRPPRAHPAWEWPDTRRPARRPGSPAPTGESPRSSGDGSCRSRSRHARPGPTA